MSDTNLVAWPVRKNFNFGTPTTTANDAANYNCILAEAAISRLRVAVEALNTLAAQHSGAVGSTKLSDCMAIIAKNAAEKVGPIP